MMMMNVIVVHIQEKFHLMKIFYQQQQWQLMKMMKNLVGIEEIMSTRWTEGSSVWSLLYPMSIFLLLTVDLWREKMRRKMPIQRKVVTPIVNERPSPFDRHTLPTCIKTKNKKNLTRSSIIKWDHVPRESILIPPTVNNDCSGISSSFFYSSDQMNKILDRWMISLTIETYNIKKKFNFF
jgi:hypothetical protein